jgi:hypothetical protein
MGLPLFSGWRNRRRYQKKLEWSKTPQSPKKKFLKEGRIN